MTERTPRRTLPRWHPDPLVQSTLERIRAYGLAVTVHDGLCAEHIHDHDGACPYAYTTGQCLSGEPELLVYGLGGDAAVGVLCDTIETFGGDDWQRLVSDEVEFTVDSIDTPLRVIEVVDKAELRVTNTIFPDTPVLQVVWADDDGIFPWEDGCSLAREAQYIKGVEGFARDIGPRFISRPSGPNRAQRRKRKR